MIGRLNTHTINVYRRSSVILDGVTTLYTHALGTTYSQNATVELTIPSGHASFTVTGLLNGLTTSSSVVFLDGGTVLTRVTDKSFNYLISIVGTTGTASTFTAKAVGKSGQPITTDSLVYTGINCRMDNVGSGNPRVVNPLVTRPDEVLCFIAGDVATEYSIKEDDIVVEQTTLDQTGFGAVSPKRFIVKNVNSYYRQVNYGYTELILAKLD